MPNDDPRQAELLGKIREGLESAHSVVGEIDTALLESSKKLRVDPSNETFTALSMDISNLGDLIALVQEIQKGVSHLGSRPVPPETFSSLDRSVDLFREMQAAMERKDWVSLADLVQYELSPLLGETKKEFAAALKLLPAP